MLVKNAENREQLEFVSLENMVPQDHLLRKIDDAIDFKKIYEFVEDLYCEDNGRPSVDPVVLFKIVLFPTPNPGRSEHESGIPVVHRISAERSSAALLHSELQLQAPIQPRHGGICVPLGVESSGRGRISGHRSDFCGRNPH